MKERGYALAASARIELAGDRAAALAVLVDADVPPVARAELQRRLDERWRVE